MMNFEPIVDVVKFFINLFNEYRSKEYLNAEQYKDIQQKMDLLKSAFINLGTIPDELINLKEIEKSLTLFQMKLPANIVITSFKNQEQDAAWDTWYNSLRAFDNDPILSLKRIFEDSGFSWDTLLAKYYNDLNTIIGNIETFIKEKKVYNNQKELNHDVKILEGQFRSLKEKLPYFLTLVNERINERLKTFDSMITGLKNLNFLG